MGNCDLNIPVLGIALPIVVMLAGIMFMLDKIHGELERFNDRQEGKKRNG